MRSLQDIGTRGQAQQPKDVTELPFYLPTFHWPKKVTWPSPNSWGRGACSPPQYSVTPFCLHWPSCCLSKPVTLPSQSLCVCFPLLYIHGSCPHVLTVFARLHLINEGFQDSPFWRFPTHPLSWRFLTMWHTYLTCLDCVPPYEWEFHGYRAFLLLTAISPTLTTAPDIELALDKC